MNKTKSGPQCELTNDIESAIYRYENTTMRYKDYWWDIVNNIFNRVREYAEYYIIDPIKKTIKKIKEFAETLIDELNKKYEFVAYVLELKNVKRKNSPSSRYLKVGETGDIETRKEQLKQSYKCDVEVKKVYKFDNEDTALSMENYMRLYFKRKNKGADFVPKDRFKEQKLTAEDIIAFNKKADEIALLFA